MMEFCLHEECVIDGNGRIKLSAGLQRDLKRHTEGEVILHCLPEGAVGLFPPDNWEKIRRPDLQPLSRFADDLAYRRLLRRFGSMSHLTTISGQGRVTIPPRLRDHAGLETGTTVILVGCEIGVEIWNPARWQAELDLIHHHASDKGNASMQADLQRHDTHSTETSP